MNYGVSEMGWKARERIVGLIVQYECYYEPPVTLLGTADASRIAMATSRVSPALKPRGTEIIPAPRLQAGGH